MKNKLIFLTFFFLGLHLDIVCQKTADKFFKSFIDSYDLSGRYTHEYHPFILKKTRNSFLELEDFLVKSGFSVDGHSLIFGYQEEAVSPYETRWCRDAIEDEVIVKNHAGLCLPTKNIFGFMTGFIFKDAAKLENSWLKKPDLPKIHHFGTEFIGLFNDDAVIFQKHAFGKDYDYLIATRDAVEKAIYKTDLKGILKELANFWSLLYENACTTGSNNVIGTQDILFSIDYIRGIIKSKSNIRNFFIGPDITYPIEVLDCQKSNSTIHAQNFVEKLAKTIEPLKNENTAYIFCSFVDGVGKSTLLNNIKNYQKFENDVKSYNRCDNSSSQEATIYRLKEKVFLVDLPAQMSHFVFKPDGMVYVDIQTVKEISIEQKQNIVNYVELNKQKIIDEFAKLKNKISSQDKPLYAYSKPIEQYVHNCLTLELEEIKWIAFEFENQNFVFDKDDINSLRILVPISQVHSIGLKVVEAEQMLFGNGLSLPMKYSAFLEDLKNKLINNDVKNIVFMDFLSMYPRSSRENIRVNFILQYLKKIYNKKYLLENSFYRHHVHQEQEICHLLYNKLDQTVKMLTLETVLRYACFKLLKKVPIESLSSLNGKNLEEFLIQYCEKIFKKYGRQVETMSKSRLEIEQEVYYQKYGQDKIYENLVRFSAGPLVKFSSIMSSLWTELVSNECMNKLWEPVKQLYDEINSGFDIKDIYKKNFDLLYRVDSLSKEESELREVFRCIRAQWYATLSNLLNVKKNEAENTIDKFLQFVPPLIVCKSSDGYLYVLQRKLPYLVDNTKKELKSSILYHVNNDDQIERKWGITDEMLNLEKKSDPFPACCLNWNNNGTFFGIYAFSFWPISPCKEIITKNFLNYKRQCIKNGSPNFGMRASHLYRKVIEEQNLFEKLTKEINFINKCFSSKIKMETIDADDARIEGIRLWVRMIATLEMILKDIDTEIFVTKGNKEDFAAALYLLEKITLLKFYGIKLKAPLFDDYAKVDPIIEWNELDTL